MCLYDSPGNCVTSPEQDEQQSAEATVGQPMFRKAGTSSRERARLQDERPDGAALIDWEAQ